jgi:hypothetical protein
MNIHHNPSYLRWKTGVETKLYEFQVTQSHDGVSGPFGTSVPPLPISAVPDSCEVPWNEMALRADKAIAAICTPNMQPRAVVTKPKHTMVMPTAYTLPSQVTAFMQGRPNGPQQRAENEMRLQERQVTTQLQAKGTTSTEGRTALAAISTFAAGQNGENQPVVNPPQAKRKATASKTTKTQRKTHVKQKQTIAPVAIIETPPAPLPTCMFGCSHGGLLDLIQMASKNTKYSLNEGNYFHGKECMDCNKQIAALFATSNSKALFYYCPVDYRVAELDHDTAVTAPQPCDCILCITCYFKRETEKQSARGTATRSSRRG